MSRRLLVIGGIKSGAVPSVLGNGKYGLLCDVTNCGDIINTLVGVSSEKERIINIVNEATNHLIKDQTDTAVAKQHIDLYEKYLIKK